MLGWDCVSVISQTLCHFPTGTWKLIRFLYSRGYWRLPLWVLWENCTTIAQPQASEHWMLTVTKEVSWDERGERQESRHKFFWLSMEWSLTMPWVRPKAEMDAQDWFCTFKAWSIIFFVIKIKDMTTKLVILVVLSEILPSCYQYYFKRPLATKE